MAEQLPSRWLRSTEWLAGHLDAPDIAIVDASWYLPNQNRDARAEYLEAHIPNAVHFDIDAIRDTSTDLPHMMPSAVEFSSAMRKMGIGDGQTVVVYDGAGLFSAPRVWWMLRSFGVARVFILDGGLPKWKAEGRPVESGMVSRNHRHFTARLNHGAIADIGDVRKAVQGGNVQMVDARSRPRFTGAEAEPRPGLKSGHMPGAFNVPASELIKDGTLVSQDEIRTIFKASGMDLEKPTITTCGSGVTAAILYLALDAIGHEPKALYDGSWAEWGGRPDCEVVSG